MPAIVDDATHESVGIEVERAISGTGVKRVLDRLCVMRGLPKAIRTDNGREFAARRWSPERTSAACSCA